MSSLEDVGDAWRVVELVCIVDVGALGRKVVDPEIRLASQLLCWMSVVPGAVGALLEVFGVCGLFGTGSQVSMLK